jgi:hypothetical protein
MNYGTSYCFGVHEVVTGAESVFMLHSDGFENLCRREQLTDLYLQLYNGDRLKGGWKSNINSWKYISHAIVLSPLKCY